jgi:hypothetical protein
MRVLHRGYSGGSIASEWAAELAADYAPELSFNGIAIGGVIPNIWNVFNAASGTMWAGLLPAGILGLCSQHADVDAYVRSRLEPANSSTFLEATSLSLDESLVLYAYQDIYSYFEGGVADLETAAVEDVIYSDGTMGHTGLPSMPLFVYKAIADEVSPVNDTDALVASLCADGATITYQRNTIGGHEANEYNGLEASFVWLVEAMAGAFASSTGCTTTNTAYNLTDSAE